MGAVTKTLLPEYKMLSFLCIVCSILMSRHAYIHSYTIFHPLQFHVPTPMYQVYPWMLQSVSGLSIGPVRVVVDFAEHDCSDGDGTYPDLGSGCQNYYVCHGERAWSYTCNPGTFFDAKIGACNLAIKVDKNCNVKNAQK